jgi:CRP/FNR family cyclic AMP-dependent transcriptional regulator
MMKGDPPAGDCTLRGVIVIERVPFMPIDPGLLSDIKFFSLLDEEDLRILGAVIESKFLPKGKTLFEKGDPGEALFIVRTGAIELFILSVTGEKIVLTIAEGGDLFGELTLAEQKSRTATAVALEDTELIVMTRENLLLFFNRKPDAALDLIAALGNIIRKADDLLRTRVSRNVNEEIAEHLTPLQRIADWIAWFSGSMQFLAVNTAWFTSWIVINTFNVGLPKFDPFPFGLLTMIVSLEAIFLSIFVLISQNRQAEKDRLRSNIDYEVNVKAEMEIAQLHDKTDRLNERMLETLARLEKKIDETMVPAKLTGGGA